MRSGPSTLASPRAGEGVPESPGHPHSPDVPSTSSTGPVRGRGQPPQLLRCDSPQPEERSAELSRPPSSKLRASPSSAPRHRDRLSGNGRLSQSGASLPMEPPAPEAQLPAQQLIPEGGSNSTRRSATSGGALSRPAPAQLDVEDVQATPPPFVERWGLAVGAPASVRLGLTTPSATVAVQLPGSPADTASITPPGGAAMQQDQQLRPSRPGSAALSPRPAVPGAGVTVTFSVVSASQPGTSARPGSARKPLQV